MCIRDRSIGCCEKYHGAIIDHCGHEHTRVFRETALLGKELEKAGVNILGTSPESIDLAEDRKRFKYVIQKLGIPQPESGTAEHLKRHSQLQKRLAIP